MFYAGEGVRGLPHGLGEVIVGGDDPEVCFFDGRRLRIPDASPKLLPPETFARAEANCLRIETWLDLRIHGFTSRPAAMMSRPESDLETAMRQAPVPLLR